jgi:CheY-like chemotaxis protein
MKKVLIIEDDVLVANIYRNKLAVEGFSVETASDGEIGLAMVQAFRPDLVILDLILPKMNGIEVLKGMRSNPAFRRTPVIVFSNTYLSNLVEQAWKAGADKCLSKANCSPKQVTDAVKASLGLNVEPVAPKQQVFEPRAKLAAAEPNTTAQVKTRKSIAFGFLDTVTALRTGVTALSKTVPGPERDALLGDLQQRIHGVIGPAGLAGMADMAQLTEAIEALLVDLKGNPANVNASTVRTLATALDFLPVMLEHPFPPRIPRPASILVVDDEPLSRRAVTHALERAKLRSVDVDDPKVALQMLTQSEYDLIFLDVDMPGMTGHELCTKLRALPHHKKTPVVFVTALNDFQNRANSMISGGNDFIAKPFPFLEMSLKSLIYVLRLKYPNATPAGAI